jgi:hypothetical protein
MGPPDGLLIIVFVFFVAFVFYSMDGLAGNAALCLRVSILALFHCHSGQFLDDCGDLVDFVQRRRKAGAHS